MILFLVLTPIFCVTAEAIKNYMGNPTIRMWTSTLYLLHYIQNNKA